MKNPPPLLLHIQHKGLLSCAGAQPFGVSDHAEAFADGPSQAARCLRWGRESRFGAALPYNVVPQGIGQLHSSV